MHLRTKSVERESGSHSWARTWKNCAVRRFTTPTAKLSGNTIELGDVGGEPGKELSFLFNSQVCLVGAGFTQKQKHNNNGRVFLFGVVVSSLCAACLLPHEQTTPETGQRVMMGCFPVAGKAPHSTLRCRVPLRRPLKIRGRASKPNNKNLLFARLSVPITASGLQGIKPLVK